MTQSCSDTLLPDEPDFIINRLRGGDILRMELLPTGRSYWFEAPFQIVSAATVDAVCQEVDLYAEHDDLFGLLENSQTWALGSVRSILSGI
ncbi:hypothetical protein C8N35_11612 [Breoghania corrubedonensis]|uniref:Uncharacterized protein n=1 Tax=Breoghania corrubedonensis TaxID=665038 RepID=A0A2T5UPW3_9HYPH|nr:hypothetical protein [Breoghania corrubedonensis]PTW53557.1 hypothetical protein C8N35_11612 [Breoghania corrubedonensis]